ncbi:hypothetical protein ACFWIJ_05380 [Streptomyces sp. NPDC127079]|uniref:hypothetical protein n=1 Tax=Streptomyces sp. NPDC127079 TaxID=3347132 RepID=UPI0036632466
MPETRRTPWARPEAATASFSVGMCTPWKSLVMWARTGPATALEPVVPMELMRALRPFAAAVSDTGTASMISAGSAP